MGTDKIVIVNVITIIITRWLTASVINQMC